MLPDWLMLSIVYAAWNDMRHFALTVPVLAYLSGYGLLEVGKGTQRALERLPVLAAAAAGGAIAFVVATLIGFQVNLTVSRWHADEAYEYEVAKAVGKKLEELNAGEIAAVCSYSPEPYNLLHGLPAIRLSVADLSHCRLGEGPVVVVVDESVRSKLGVLPADTHDSLERLFTVEIAAPYLDGRSVQFDTDPAVVYITRDHSPRFRGSR